MIEAYFCTFTVYGFWLPNDPRGSGSVYVGKRELLPYGLATKVSTRKSVARKSCDPVVRREAKGVLKYSPVRLNGVQAMWMGRAFGEVVEEDGLVVYACAIMHDHVHMVVARSGRPVERVVWRLKARATMVLARVGLHPFQHEKRVRGQLPKMWGRGDWSVYLNCPEEVREKIRYVEGNPLKEGMKRQRWRFLTEYEG